MEQRPLMWFVRRSEMSGLAWIFCTLISGMVGKSVGFKEVTECTTVDRTISRKLKENTKAGGGRQWEGEVGEGRQMHHDTNCIDS